jgi:hypothetical protein
MTWRDEITESLGEISKEADRRSKGLPPDDRFDTAIAVLLDLREELAQPMLSTAAVVPYLPVYPRVRCDACGNVYLAVVDNAQVVCPECHSMAFSTNMTVGQVEAVPAGRAEPS